MVSQRQAFLGLLAVIEARPTARMKFTIRIFEVLGIWRAHVACHGMPDPFAWPSGISLRGSQLQGEREGCHIQNHPRFATFLATKPNLVR